MRRLLTLIIFINSISVGFSQDKELLVFVGEKISILKQQQPRIALDTLSGVGIDIELDKSLKIKTDTLFLLGSPVPKYTAIYQIKELINGNFREDTISFVIHTYHNRHKVPTFFRYKNVLLFLYKKDGRYYHIENQFFAVYKTKNNRWASPYTNEGNSPNSSLKLKPEKIRFKEELFFSVCNYDREFTKRRYPSPYYKIKGNKAIAIYGNYIEELIEFKKQGILNSLGYSLK